MILFALTVLLPAAIFGAGLGLGRAIATTNPTPERPIPAKHAVIPLQPYRVRVRRGQILDLES